MEQTQTLNGERLTYFNVDKPFTVSKEVFEIKWPQVDNVWVQVGQTKLLKKGSGWTKTYDCRFKKRHSSSTKDSSLQVEKRRKTNIQLPNLCEAMITITLKNGVVTIRKTHGDNAPDHTHDLEASDIRKMPSIVLDFVKTEVEKGYRAPAVKEAAINTFKDQYVGVEYLPTKIVLNTQRNLQGGLNVPFIGVEDLEIDIKDAIEWLQSQGHQTEVFVKGSYRGFAFATADNLNVL